MRDRTRVCPRPCPVTPRARTAQRRATVDVPDSYQRLGWRLDADITAGEDFRVVQFTPPRSQCSIHFGKGLTTAAPGSVDRIILAVEDIEAARAELTARGVEVTDVDDMRPAGSSDRSYFLYASFKDPDGNGWLLQEITTRLPGREWND